MTDTPKPGTSVEAVELIARRYDDAEDPQDQTAATLRQLRKELTEYERVLKDPSAVHVAMLRGDIAYPGDQIHNVNGGLILSQHPSNKSEVRTPTPERIGYPVQSYGAIGMEKLK